MRNYINLVTNVHSLHKPDTIALAIILALGRAETGGLLQVHGQPGLHSEYRERAHSLQGKTLSQKVFEKENVLHFKRLHSFSSHTYTS